MPARTEHAAASFQSQFHRRWGHLNDPHVRTLAWLLDAPDLLDSAAVQWQGRVATLGALDTPTGDWLTSLDLAPAALHSHLDAQPFTRLGRYAEKLMAFYLAHCGRLVAHGVQVHDAKGATVGEFDFLLQHSDGLLHWEFATKLYLLEASGRGHQADYFVGPNLADTLGAKIRKIMDRQLLLSRHPAAQAQLPQPVVMAQALVKGWLFYHAQTPLGAPPPGISHPHCHGFWTAVGELETAAGQHYVILPRLRWLAPAKVDAGEALDGETFRNLLAEHFSHDTAPLLIAVLEPGDSCMLEVDRGFIVPDDWHERADARMRRVA